VYENQRFYTMRITEADHISLTQKQSKLTSVHKFTIDTDLFWFLIIKHETRQLYSIDTNLPHYTSSKLLCKKTWCFVPLKCNAKRYR